MLLLTPTRLNSTGSNWSNLCRLPRRCRISRRCFQRLQLFGAGVEIRLAATPEIDALAAQFVESMPSRSKDEGAADDRGPSYLSDGRVDPALQFLSELLDVVRSEFARIVLVLEAILVHFIDENGSAREVDPAAEADGALHFLADSDADEQQGEAAGRRPTITY